MKVSQLKEGDEVKGITLRVTRRWNIRSIVNGLEEFSDDGPLKAEKSKVFTVLVRDEMSPEDHTEMMLFFYDLWAEKTFFIQNGDKLMISGPKEMVLRSNGDLQDFPFCLVFTQENQSELIVESVNIDNASKSTKITSRSLSDVVVPIRKGEMGTLSFYQHLSHKRKRNATEDAPTISKSTAGIRLSTFVTGNATGASSYEYIALSSLPSYTGTKDKLNLYGVISSYQQPKHCNGRHNFSFSFTIVDPLHYPIPTNSFSSKIVEASDPLVVQCFADSIDSFPPIRRVGDLIRLHRCTLQMYQNRPQILWFHQKSSYLLFSHPLVDELVGLPSEETNARARAEAELPSAIVSSAEEELSLPLPLLQELRLEEFSSSETHIDEQVERDYIQFLSLWSVGYFLSTGYSSGSGSSLPLGSSLSTVDPNKNFHLSLRKLKENVTSTSTSVNMANGMDFIGMFVGIFPPLSSSSASSSSAAGVGEHDHLGNRYLYVWDGSSEGGIYPSTSPLPNSLSSNEYLKTTSNIYQRIELSVRIVLRYNETLSQLLKSTVPSTTTAGARAEGEAGRAPSIESILTALHQSLSQLVNERNNLPDSNLTPASHSDPKALESSSRYLPGGFGILSLPPSCISQLGVVSSLRPGTWIRARKLINGSVENIPHLHRSEIVCARLTVGSSINVLPPFHCDVLSLGKSYDQFRRTCLSAHSIPKSLPRRLYSSSGQSYTPLALVLASPSPGRFLSLVKIVSYFPESFENFVVHKSTGLPITLQSLPTVSDSTPAAVIATGGTAAAAVDLFGSEVDPTDLTYMFALRIHDDTACADAIVFGMEGQTFFGRLPEDQFISDHRIRSELKSYLDKVVADGVIFELNLMTYFTPASPLDAPASPSVKRIALINSSILTAQHNHA